MKFHGIALCALGLLGTAHASPSDLALPESYDNVGVGMPWGQTFEAVGDSLEGVRWYIGDPSRPDVSSVNALEGVADLLLYNAANLTSPVELARARVQGLNGFAFGLVDFRFLSPIPTTVGAKYFVALDAVDGFGMGIRQSLTSTYPNGAQGYIQSGAIILAASGRDTSFEILASPVPEPSAILLWVFGLGVLGTHLGRQRR